MRTLTIIAASALLAGCATAPERFQPVIDTKDVDSSKLTADVAECQTFSLQATGTGEAAIAGALAGAVLGALLGAATKTSRNEGAMIGALLAAPGAAVRAEGDQRLIVSRCLAGRGYRVLN